MTETQANGYSSKSTQRELSNEYQHDRVKTVFKNLCVLVLRTKVALALEGLIVGIFQVKEPNLYPIRLVDTAAMVGVKRVV